MEDPLSPTEAKRLIREILENGDTAFGSHARLSMSDDNLVDGDILNTLRAGVVEPAEWEGNEWRYRVRTSRMVAWLRS